MPLALKVQKYTPTDNPDYAILAVAASGNYTTAVGGDTANLNPGTWTDPNGVGILAEPLGIPATPASIESEDMGGYYANVRMGATLATSKIKFYAPGGAELGSGAYPAAITGGVLTVKVPLR